MSNILLFGAGKSATTLISYLVEQVSSRRWQLTVADSDAGLVKAKLGSPETEGIQAIGLDVRDEAAREAIIRQADLVISLLPPQLHLLVALSCVKWEKHLLTASYLDDQIKALESDIRERGLLFLCEMGLDPGIDHMSAMQLIHRIHSNGGRIHRFRSHTGGLVAPESDDNPWHYKISWNPRNVVRAGSAGAQYKLDGAVIVRSYAELFVANEEVQIPGIGPLAWYPNRDSLAYIPIYGLEEAKTFIRTTLRYPAFCRAWQAIVQAGLTDDREPLKGHRSTLVDWASPILPYIRDDTRPAIEWLGFFEKLPLPDKAITSADVLQYQLETRLAMCPGDKDMIVMLHEIGYAQEEQSAMHEIRSHLIVKGEDNLHTAMAKTVGLPLGIAAMLILEKKIGLTGLHIPIRREIYQPVLEELDRQGIRFVEH